MKFEYCTGIALIPIPNQWRYYIVCLTKQHIVDNKLCWDLRLLVIIPMWVTWSHSQVLQSHSHVGHLVSFPVSFLCGSPGLITKSLRVIPKSYSFIPKSYSLIPMWVTWSHSQSHSHVGHHFQVSFPVSFSCGSPGLIPSLILMWVTRSYSHEEHIRKHI